MFKRYFLLLFILCKSCFINAQNIKGLPFKQYFTAREYKGGIQNRTITQNVDGLIYVANNFGLLEFDGTSWKRYTLPNETKLRDIKIGNDGEVFVASQGDFGYFAANKRNRLQYISLADSLEDKYRNFDETWKVFIRNDEVIFCTFSGIFIYKNKRLDKILSTGDQAEDFFIVNNTLYISSVHKGLSYFVGDELTTMNDSRVLDEKLITTILPLTEDQLWVSTLNNGIYIYDGSRFNAWSSPLNERLKNSLINNCLRLSNGNIAIGTENEGIYVVSPNGKLILQMNKNDGLPNRTILSTYEDKLGNLWLGHNNGITLLELNIPFTIIDEFDGLPGTGYDGFLLNNLIYLGTNNGLFVKKRGSYENFELIAGTEGQVYTLQRIDNQLLLGHHRGTFIIEGRNATQISDELGSWTLIKPNENRDHIIVGTYNGLNLFTHKNGKLQFERKIIGLTESSRVIEQDDDGTLWMTHGYKGVYKININENFDSLSYSFYNKEDGFPSNILINVWKIDNRIVFSSEKGVYYYDSKSDSFKIDDFFIEHFTVDAQISFLEQDVLGNIYYLANNDVGVLEKQPDGSYAKKNKIFNRLKSQLNDDLQKLSILETNKILYAAKEGFILYSKEDHYDSNEKYKTLIRNAIIANGSDSVLSNGIYNLNGKTVYQQPDNSIPVLSYNNNSIRIEYSAPFIHSDNSIQYQFKLEGYEDDWSKWTVKTDKEYTNIREGSYSFHVRAINNYGVVSEEAIYAFIISAPWFRTMWAYMAYVLIITAIIFLLYFLVDKRHEKEKKLLALNKQIEINNKSDALRFSEEEVSRLKNEKLENQLEIQNKELASSTMHLLTKNSFINSMKHNISNIIKRTKNQDVKKELSKIMTNIDRNMAEDEAWEQFSMHFDQVHGDFNSRIKADYPKLTPQEMKLSAYLRMNLTTKEIAHLLNITVRGVEIARYRLRKKFELERQTNLQEFILKY